MSNTSAPVPAVLADLPAKVRVHALAKMLGRTSKDVLAALTDLGQDGRSAQSSVDRATAVEVAGALLGPAQQDIPDQAEPVAQTEPAQPEPAGSAPVGSAPVIPPLPVFASASPLFLPPEPSAPARKEPRRRRAAADTDQPADAEAGTPVGDTVTAADSAEPAGADDAPDADDGDEANQRKRRRGRRGRGRGRGGAGDDADGQDGSDAQDGDQAEDAVDAPSTGPDTGADADDDGDSANKRRRRRRRRRGGDDEGPTEDDPPNTVVHVREAREAREAQDNSGRDEVRSVRGSTRLEAKRQRRRDGREAGRRRAPILSEAEFLARREAVDRAMVVREHGDRTQIGVLEDGILVEHFVTSAGTGSLVGNVYLGRVQNVLPSMEAAFIDIGRGRNAVLYAGEVDWDAAGLEGKARKIEQALSSGDSVLVQVTKDPVGHKGARLTTQISLPGRFLVYVPGGGATGISRKLPENERKRLKDILKRIVPEDAGVIIRTASEGISEEELGRDVRRLQAQWEIISEKASGSTGSRKSNAPTLLYEEPDLLVKVVRDLFTEDFSGLVVQGATAWETIESYVRHVAPELTERLRRHVGPKDVFAEHRIDEQLLKALDRKVWLPSGGYLIIDRTEAMTVIDVNTGKFTGSGGNLEETVTRNNLESAEEIVRQLRLRDIGGIIVIDFIDMVLESNRDLVLRRLTECLGRDRTRHQVAEVTSLGLVQMTRKRVGTGLLEAFSSTCEHCKGRGLLVSTEPVTRSSGNGASGASGSASGSSGGSGGSGQNNGNGSRRGRNRGDSGRGDTVKADTPDQDAKADSLDPGAREAARNAVRGIAMATAKTTDHPDPAAVADQVTAELVDGGTDTGATAFEAGRQSEAAAIADQAEPEQPATGRRSRRRSGAKSAARNEPSAAGDATDDTTATDDGTDGTDGTAVSPRAGRRAGSRGGTRSSGSAPSGSAAVGGAPSTGTTSTDTPSTGASPDAGSIADGGSAVVGAAGQGSLTAAGAGADVHSGGSASAPAGNGANGAQADTATGATAEVPAQQPAARGRGRRRAASRPAGPPVGATGGDPADGDPGLTPVSAST